MKKIKALSIVAAFIAAFAFSSCNSSSDNSFQWPSAQESSSMLSEVQGYHSAGLLLPASVNANSNSTNADKFEKDSLTTTCVITSSDSTLTLQNVDVAKFAKYINDETISKEVAKLPAQDLKIKLIPYNYQQRTFVTATNDITYTNEAGKKVQIQFYSGINNLSYGGIGTRKDNSKRELILNVTPGRILVDGSAKDVLKTYSYQGYNMPYVATLEVVL